MDSTRAWRVNNMCCILAAFSAALLASTCLRLIGKGSRFALSGACITAFLFALSPLVWEYSIGAEVFAVNNAIIAALIYLTVDTHYRIACSDNNGWFTSSCLGALLSGLALSNQHTSLLLIVILVPYVLIITRNRLTTSSLGVFSALFLLGLSPYLYLVWASMDPKPGSWGNMTSLPGLMRHILRSEYGTFQLGIVKGSETALQRMSIYLWHLQQESFHCLLPLAMMGLLFTWRDGCGDVNGVKGKTDHTVDSNGDSSDSGGGGGHRGRPSSLRKRKVMLTKRSFSGGDTTGSATETEHRDNTIPPHPTTSPKTSHPPPLPSSLSQGKLVVLGLVVAWVFYVLIWHGVLSNLPLSAPMPFAVHSRFWMQPNVILAVLAGVGCQRILAGIESFVTTSYLLTQSQSQSQSQSKHVVGATSVSANTTATTTATATTANDVGNGTTGTGTGTGGRYHHYISSSLEIVMITVLLAIVLGIRFPVMDRSRGGWTMHRYGESILQSLSSSSSSSNNYTNKGSGKGSGTGTGPAVLLLAHTDLNWNPVRYLLTCEDMRSEEGGGGARWSNVRHLSIQLVPYPWFKSNQEKLYPDVIFPKLSPKVSTDRSSDENGKLVSSLLKVNIKSGNFPGGVFVDMQAVNDVELAPGGLWRENLMLVPWGLLYKVELYSGKGLGEHRHKDSLNQLKLLQIGFPDLDVPFHRMFPRSGGSWEFAAASVYNDAHYQLGLHFLTYSMEAQKLPPSPPLAMMLDRLLTACDLLETTLSRVSGESPLFREGGSSALSSPPADLLKNCGLCFLRLEGAMHVALQFKGEVQRQTGDPAVSGLLLRSATELVDEVSVASHKRTVDRALAVVMAFLRQSPSDKDGQAFSNALFILRDRYVSLSKL
eukprot:gene3920-7816_t